MAEGLRAGYDQHAPTSALRGEVSQPASAGRQHGPRPLRQPDPGRSDGLVSRRTTLKALAVGGLVPLLGPLTGEAEAGKGKCRNCRKRLRRARRQIRRLTQKGPCDGRNWCTDRTQTCGPEGSYGKCLIEASGGNVCAEVLFQVPDCSGCAEPSCVDCVCVLAAGGGDRCNNGANGYDFICARPVA